ncbi:MAG: SPASM domain-containing protein, partial [Myxococcota bacterium]
LLPGNNLGYFGPEEARLRSPDPTKPHDHWQGCQAGRYVMGLESDGAVKGCPSLLTAHYDGGRVRERSIRSIWKESDELSFARASRRDELWGFCASCAFADPCFAGCSFTAQALLGRRGNNPYCHFRARDFFKRGLRERLVPDRPAEGRPFDNGTFTLIEEPWDSPEPKLAPADLVQITRRPSRTRR